MFRLGIIASRIQIRRAKIRRRSLGHSGDDSIYLPSYLFACSGCHLRPLIFWSLSMPWGLLTLVVHWLSSMHSLLCMWTVGLELVCWPAIVLWRRSWRLADVRILTRLAIRIHIETISRIVRLIHRCGQSIGEGRRRRRHRSISVWRSCIVRRRKKWSMAHVIRQWSRRVAESWSYEGCRGTVVLLNDIRGCSSRAPTKAFTAVPTLFTSRTAAITFS